MMVARVRWISLCCLLSPLMPAGGCVQTIGRPPRNTTEYREHQRIGQRQYPKYVILQHNLQRTLDGQLSPQERVESLRLADHLGGEEPAVRSSIGSVLAEPSTPPELRHAALTFLMNRDTPDLAGHIMRAWPALSSNRELRQAALDWLSRHRSPRVLGEVVKLWARDPMTSRQNEQRFRLVVEKITGKRWDRSLLDGLNAAVFFARGSAIEILSKRLTPQDLRARVLRMTPKTHAIEALQFFIDRFDYLPRNGNELLSSVIALRQRRDALHQAEKSCQNWRSNGHYEFNIRDQHLLSRLAGDPLRKKHSRSQLKADISKALGLTEHALNGRLARHGNFDRLAVRLTMADLWNIRLLNEMLNRERVQLAIKIMAEGDRVDKRSQWGGLIFYENGQAEAKLYTPDRKAGENDMAYASTKRFIRDGRGAMCRFVAHFEKAQNVSLARPTKAELLQSRRGNYYGLVLTSISERMFSAHYYNPQGQVVSLGLYPFKK